MHKVCIVTLIFLCITGNALAQRTVYVDGAVATTGDGSLASPFKTIGEAIDASAMGDEIRIAGGTYDNEMPDKRLKGSLTVRGGYDSTFTTSDPAVTPTIIDMARLGQQEQDRTFRCQSITSFTLENLTIQNSSSGEFGDTDNGGAIYIQNGSSGVIRGVSFINCASKFEGGIDTGPARDGGAVCIRDASTVVFEDCIFDGCTAVGRGGAINMRSAGSGNNVKIHRCLFTNCGSRGGASVVHDVDSSSQVEIVNCLFVNNGVDVVDTTGIYPSRYEISVADSRALIYNCTFVGSNDPNGLMFDLRDSSSGSAAKEIINCIIANNTIGSDGSGYAIFGYPGGYNDATTVQNNLFFSNSGLAPLDPAGTGIIGVNGNIAGEPQFVDPANGDYHLKAGSPGMDAGQTLALVTDDLEGTLRPVGEAYDIGALEGLGSLDPLYYKVQNIAATASSSFNADSGPEKTVDRSGLNDLDQHDTTPANMWLSATGQEPPVWIQYEFDNVYKLNQMWVWNSNNALEGILVNFGVKTATIEYSTDGVTWTALTDVPEFAQAPGTADYAHNTMVDFNGAAARFVRITCTSNWGGGSQCGLSEVRFFYYPVQARDPNPKDGATGAAINTTLSWKAGQEAAEHRVYFSDDEQAIIDGTAPVVTVNEPIYGPLSLNLASTYYWRIDEVNYANTLPVWEGSTWSFTTRDYLVVDDFESYNDVPEGQEGSNLIYLTWIDGYDNPSTNGSTMGYTSGASLSTATVRSGHSAPLMYDNTKASISEVIANTNDLQCGSDWTIGGSPTELVLWVYGNANNNSGTDQMYVKVDGVKRIFSGDIASEEWQQFTIDLASLGINLNNVRTLTIGFERKGASGGAGIVFIDDIRLYR
jgi:hypothetical protein